MIVRIIEDWKRRERGERRDGSDLSLDSWWGKWNLDMVLLQVLGIQCRLNEKSLRSLRSLRLKIGVHIR